MRTLCRLEVANPLRQEAMVCQPYKGMPRSLIHWQLWLQHAAYKY